jgi:hypothetical protein
MPLHLADSVNSQPSTWLLGFAWPFVVYGLPKICISLLCCLIWSVAVRQMSIVFDICLTSSQYRMLDCLNQIDRRPKKYLSSFDLVWSVPEQQPAHFSYGSSSCVVEIEYLVCHTISIWLFSVIFGSSCNVDPIFVAYFRRLTDMLKKMPMNYMSNIFFMAARSAKIQ